MYETARYSNYLDSSFDPGHVKCIEKGKNFICVMADGRNESRDGEPVGSKVTRIVIENYIRRPSLKDEALDKISEFANSGVMVKQTPTCRVECDTAVLMIQKDKFRWVRYGNIHLYHFVDGQLVLHGGDARSTALGSASELHGDAIPASELGEGENSFLICSESFARRIRPAEMENALSAADSPDQWLKMLKDLYEDRSNGEAFSLMTVFVPSKRKRVKKPVVIAVIVVLVLLIAFFAMGAVRRGKGPGPGGPEGGPGGPGGPNPPTQPPQPSQPAFAVPYDDATHTMLI